MVIKGNQHLEAEVVNRVTSLINMLGGLLWCRHTTSMHGTEYHEYHTTIRNFPHMGPADSGKLRISNNLSLNQYMCIVKYDIPCLNEKSCRIVTFNDRFAKEVYGMIDMHNIHAKPIGVI